MIPDEFHSRHPILPSMYERRDKSDPLYDGQIQRDFELVLLSMPLTSDDNETLSKTTHFPNFPIHIS